MTCALVRVMNSARGFSITGMRIVFILVAFLFLLSIGNIRAQQCDWKVKTNEEIHNSPEIFWVNMDKSADRRRSLQMHLDQLGWLHRRVKGLSLDDIYIPSDIRSLWDQYEAKEQTSEVILDRKDPKFFGKYGNVTHFLVGLVGRGKKNRLKEIGCTSSHLEAMRQAIYNNRSSSKYAVITEDDIYIPFDIDFQRLAESAPRDFGILQLFNSNEESMESTWKFFRRNPKENLWVENRVGTAASYWSTCAYIINRDVMKSVIDAVIYEEKNSIQMKIVAGIRKPCRPKLTSCCVHVPGTYSYEFQDRPPCFIAPKGFQADSFLYAMNKTYVLTLPLITNGAGGNQSTFHQDHVGSIHQAAFLRQRRYINELIQAEQYPPLPPFVQKACPTALPLQMELRSNQTCGYSSPQRRSTSLSWLFLGAPGSSQQDWLSDYVRNVVGREGMPMSLVTENQVYVPEDLVAVWDSKHCKLQSTDELLQHAASTTGGTLKSGALQLKGFQVALSGLCGRSRSPSLLPNVLLRDLASTSSHIRALHHLMQKTNRLTSATHAIVSAGDVVLPFDIDFEALVASAPADFGFLTFLVDQPDLLDRLWQNYTSNISPSGKPAGNPSVNEANRNHEHLWTRVHEKYLSSVSAQFYIVNLAILEPYLDEIVQRHQVDSAGQSLTTLRIISSSFSGSSAHAGKQHGHKVTNKKSVEESTAGNVKSHCYPRECCSDPDDLFPRRLPRYCVSTGASIATAGSLKAEAYLWHLAPTYTCQIPLVLRGRYGPSGLSMETSTSPQWVLPKGINATSEEPSLGNRRERHSSVMSDTAVMASDVRRRQLINNLHDGQATLPSFVKIACPFHV